MYFHVARVNEKNIPPYPVLLEVDKIARRLDELSLSPARSRGNNMREDGAQKCPSLCLIKFYRVARKSDPRFLLFAGKKMSGDNFEKKCAEEDRRGTRRVIICDPANETFSWPRSPSLRN